MLIVLKENISALVLTLQSRSFYFIIRIKRRNCQNDWRIAFIVCNEKGGIVIKELFTGLGFYNLRARVSVGIIFMAPGLLELYLLLPEIRNISSTLIVGVICYGICNVIIIYCRIPGVKAMKKCFPDLLPAQEYLLPSNRQIDRVTKNRYYKFLTEHIDNFKISDNDEEMKPYASTAVTWLIAKTRTASDFPLIAEENTNFGFAYNLLGLKPYGVTLSCIGIAVNSILIVCCYSGVLSSIDLKILFAGMIINAFFLMRWLFIVTRGLVTAAGRKYARALLAACDSDKIK